VLRRRPDTDDLRRRDRIIAVRTIKDIPEGTKGTVKAVVGQAWTRYFVKWDTGEWMGTVDGSTIVREDRLDAYHERQAELAQRSQQTVAEVAPSAALSGASGGQVPDHLLERSRQARARAAAKAS
jgi:hypothetical protein